MTNKNKITVILIIGYFISLSHNSPINTKRYSDDEYHRDVDTSPSSLQSTNHEWSIKNGANLTKPNFSTEYQVFSKISNIENVLITSKTNFYWSNGKQITITKLGDFIQCDLLRCPLEAEKCVITKQSVSIAEVKVDYMCVSQLDSILNEMEVIEPAALGATPISSRIELSYRKLSQH